jgi:hypothetical protein
MVRVPVRRAGTEFAATEKVTSPSPEPAEPAVTAMKSLLLAADQAQPAGAVTFTVTLSPAAGEVREDADS